MRAQSGGGVTAAVGDAPVVAGTAWPIDVAAAGAHDAQRSACIEAGFLARPCVGSAFAEVGIVEVS